MRAWLDDCFHYVIAALHLLQFDVFFPNAATAGGERATLARELCLRIWRDTAGQRAALAADLAVRDPLPRSLLLYSLLSEFILNRVDLVGPEAYQDSIPEYMPRARATFPNFRGPWVDSDMTVLAYQSDDSFGPDSEDQPPADPPGVPLPPADRDTTGVDNGSSDGPLSSSSLDLDMLAVSPPATWQSQEDASPAEGVARPNASDLQAGTTSEGDHSP